jgi:hypothetical protein
MNCEPHEKGSKSTRSEMRKNPQIAQITTDSNYGENEKIIRMNSL